MRIEFSYAIHFGAFKMAVKTIMNTRDEEKKRNLLRCVCFRLFCMAYAYARRSNVKYPIGKATHGSLFLCVQISNQING